MSVDIRLAVTRERIHSNGSLSFTVSSSFYSLPLYSELHRTCTPKKLTKKFFLNLPRFPNLSVQLKSLIRAKGRIG